MIGSLPTNWTIRLALICYAVVVASELVSPSFRARRWTRLAWMLGCWLFLAHAACAFHFFHGWSHAAASAHTAERTGQLIGWEFGAGVYFNYAFALLWAIDVCWWSIRPGSYIARGWRVNGAIHGYMFFIALNGAVIFEDGPTRWWGAAAAVGLVALLLRRMLKKRDPPTPCPLPAPRSPT